jgi:hypothetical protein
MKNTLRSAFALTLLASLTLASTQSMADTSTVYIQDGSFGNGMTLNLVLPIQTGAQNYIDVAQNITVGSTLSRVGAQSFLAYCIDPSQWSPGSATAAYSVANFATTFGNTRDADVSKLYSQSYAGTSGSNVNTAAFQIALWELANDDGNLATGGVRTTGSTDASVVAAAGSMLDNVKTKAAGSTQYNFSLYTSPTQQDYLVATAAVTAVPEPETYAMLLAGLGLIGAVRRRRAAK